MDDLDIDCYMAITFVLHKFTTKRYDTYMVNKNTLGVKKWCDREKQP